MSEHNSLVSDSLNVLPNSSFTLRLMLPEAFFNTCMNASCSPCMSARKCSVPLGRLSMACRLMISVLASATVGNSCESKVKYRVSCLKS